jgi:serine O-acetyltransferase
LFALTEPDRNIGGSSMIFKNILEEIDAIIERDPAARSRWEVVFSYPSFHAMRFHRVSSWLWRRDFRWLARFVSQWGRFLTGIEIHPGAKIGHRFFADHGMGVVIGETAEIGDNVTLYHDVTLGGTSPSVNSRAQIGVKRHPTLEDDVIVGSGAQILGPITVARGARVGANAVVVQNVPAAVTVVGIPARIVGEEVAANASFMAYGTPCQDMPDPMQCQIDLLIKAVGSLQQQVATLEGKLAEQEEQPAANVAALHPKVVNDRN